MQITKHLKMMKKSLYFKTYVLQTFIYNRKSHSRDDRWQQCMKYVWKLCTHLVNDILLGKSIRCVLCSHELHVLVSPFQGSRLLWPHVCVCVTGKLSSGTLCDMLVYKLKFTPQPHNPACLIWDILQWE